MLDPRFSGGTGSAVAAEILAINAHVDLSVHALETQMFTGRRVNAALERALEACGLELIWNASVIRADTIVFHNPSALKFNDALEIRFSCQRGFVVTHENFLRPNGSQGFDVDGCLALLRAAFVCERLALAPVSAYNRRGVETWNAANAGAWAVAEFDWFNICDHATTPPTASPRDRRGRHSRAGPEKFPDPEVMIRLFPSTAERCAILGGDALLNGTDAPPGHWEVLRFGEQEVSAFLGEIDFFVYFTHPNWRESFGRAISEAIAAGKLVITDPGTAAPFGNGVVTADTAAVDAVIAGFIADPERYAAQVRIGQAALERYRPEAFVKGVLQPAIGAERTRYALV